MNMEKAENPKPEQVLIRNLQRRRELLARISRKEPEDIPEVIIKDTLLKFLDKTYKHLEAEELGAEKIEDLNMRIFMLINRAASLATKRQDTAPVTSMYVHQRGGAKPIDEVSYKEFKQEVKNIVKLCRTYNISLKSITGMQNGLGVPDEPRYEEILENLKKP